MLSEELSRQGFVFSFVAERLERGAPAVWTSCVALGLKYNVNVQ